MHGPHFNHGPLGLALRFAPVRLHVSPGQLQVKDSIDGLLVARVCFQLTTCQSPIHSLHSLSHLSMPSVNSSRVHTLLAEMKSMVCKVASRSLKAYTLLEEIVSGKPYISVTRHVAAQGRRQGGYL